MNYNRCPVNGRFFITCGASVLILILAKGALADGAYQRTEDRKQTLVWNNDPKPGDAASWSGDRDAEGYATGTGTLKWFRAERVSMTGSNLSIGTKKTLISSYTGAMVRGKLSGNVTTVDHGKTYHATFADGHRKGGWIAGPLISKAQRVEEAAAPEKIERAEAATSASTDTESANANKAATKTETTDIPAQGPAEETTEANEQKSEASKPVASDSSEPPKLKTQSSPPLVAQNSAAEPDESATPREPVTKKAALAPGAVRAIERPTTASVPKKAATPRAKSAETDIAKTEKTSKTAKSAPSQPIEAETQISKDIPAEGPPAVAAEKNQTDAARSTTEAPTKPAAKETPVDDSIRTLTGPPSSLHVNPPAETKAPAQTTEAATSSASGAKLTAVQAMDIADIEARTKGFDLGEYQLPKAEYNAADDTWSVSYAARDDKTVKKLSVTIRDKTGKAEVNR
jgi:hypothetical protein